MDTKLSDALERAFPSLEVAAKEMRVSLHTLKSLKLGRRKGTAATRRKVVAWLRTHAEKIRAGADELERGADRGP